MNEVKPDWGQRIWIGIFILVLFIGIMVLVGKF